MRNREESGLAALDFFWAESHVGGMSFPRDDRVFEVLAANGFNVVLNLSLTPHPDAFLNRLGISQVHLPIEDYVQPEPATLERAVAVIDDAVRTETNIAVHCLAGKGRTGMVLACYLMHKQGLAPEDAIARIRQLRPGAIDSPAFVDAIVEFARTHRG